MPFNLEWMQWISSTLLAVTSLIVAFVALKFSYRSNYGWKPIVLVTQQGVARIPDSKDTRCTIIFEVWNRRKYPVVIKDATVSFEKIPVDGLGQWGTYEGKAVQTGPQILEPSSHLKCEAQMLLKEKVSKMAQNEIVTVEINLFDPIANEIVKIAQSTKFLHMMTRRKWWKRLFELKARSAG